MILMKKSLVKLSLTLKKTTGLMIVSTLYSIINANQLSGDKGPYVLAQKLSQKGIVKSTIEEILKILIFRRLLNV